MKLSVTDEIKVVLKQNKLSSVEVSEARKYIEASNIYNKLIASGHTKPRGNNLLSRDKALTTSVRFNK
jgi:hypothetical protein